jgi:small GTP-binding protein
VEEVISKVKVVVVGDQGVGKTQVCNRMVNNAFSDNSHSTIGVPVSTVQLGDGNNHWELQLTDTSGKRFFPAYYNHAQIVFVVWDAMNDPNFLELETWLNESKTHAPNAPLVFIRSKVDMVKDKKTGVIDPISETLLKKITELTAGRTHHIVSVSAKDTTGFLGLTESIVACLRDLPVVIKQPEVSVVEEVAPAPPREERKRKAREKAEAKRVERKRARTEKKQAAIAASNEKRKQKLIKIQEAAPVEAVQEEEVQQQDILKKIVVIGESGVGKTYFIKLLVDDVFVQKKPTMGVDFYNKLIVLESGQQLRVTLWDISGHENSVTILTSNLENTSVFFLVWDPSDEKSFDVIPKWLAQIKKNAAPNAPIIFIRGKKDSFQQSAEEIAAENGQIAEWAQGFNYEIAEVSSKANTGFDPDDKNGFIYKMLEFLKRSFKIKDEVVPAQEVNAPKEGVYKTTNYRFTRQARRISLESELNVQKDDNWLWLNWKSIYSLRGSSTVKDWISKQLGAYNPPADILSGKENKKNKCAMKLLELLDERETSIPVKIGTFFSNNYNSKVKEERQRIYSTAKSIYDGSNLRDAEYDQLPKDAQKILEKYGYAEKQPGCCNIL